jgi:hypothetical protein
VAIVALDYDEKHRAGFGRTEAGAEVDGGVFTLDLMAQGVSDIVRSETTSREAYCSELSTLFG